VTSVATILPLDADAPIDLVGGKGHALSKLTRAGLPVPTGFLITTRAYDEFVSSNDLREQILTPASALEDADFSETEQVAADIAALFEEANIPGELEAEICAAYAVLENQPVAVRSSATAEDLPDASFAGQQDSFLNVRGRHAFLTGLKSCWASLWTARAMTYRARMGIDHGSVSMGVVVQVMVEADASGILFTANPTTGDRSEIVVNAGLGLGDAIVGGEVSPDAYVLDRGDFSLKEARETAKTDMSVPSGEQGTQLAPVPENLRNESVLDSEALSRLAQLSLEAESVLGGMPQDVEWAVAGGVCWLLQSRPVTNLPDPQPGLSWEAPYEGAKLIRRQVVENMPEPLSPLFEELYLADGLDLSIDAFTAEMDLPFDVEEFIERPMFVTVNGYGYCRYEFRASWKMLALIPRVIFWYVTALPKLLKNLVEMWREGLAEYQDCIERCQRRDVDDFSIGELISGIRELARADARYWFHISIAVGAAKVSEAMLDWFVGSRWVEGELSAALFLRGFPSKTLEAQSDLARIAQAICRMPSVRDAVLNSSVDGL
jgi:pyruvate,water dikinase